MKTYRISSTNYCFLTTLLVFILLGPSVSAQKVGVTETNEHAKVELKEEKEREKDRRKRSADIKEGVEKGDTKARYKRSFRLRKAERGVPPNGNPTKNKRKEKGLKPENTRG